MDVTLAMVCAEIKNWFYLYDDEGKPIFQKGDYSIGGEHISPVEIMLLPGQYIRIIGSVLNDGVYLIPEDGGAGSYSYLLEGSRNEEFKGYLIPMAVPLDFIVLVDEIKTYQDKSAQDQNSGAVTSESFSGYSYTKATTLSGAAVSWREVFSSRLGVYRKMFAERIDE